MQVTNPQDKKDIFQRLKELYQSEKITPKAPSAPLPKMITMMRQLERDKKSALLSTAELFVKEGNLAADYEDDYVYDKPVLHYFPTYRVFTDEELRGYFGWRTRLRHGSLEKGPLTYAFLYIYEQLNLIGLSSPQEGYDKLKAFGDQYGELDSGILSYLNLWLRDFVLYYQLPAELIPVTTQSKRDTQFAVLQDWQNRTDAELFEALDGFSTYRLTRSKLYSHYPDMFQTLIGQCYRKIQEHYAKHRQKTFLEDYGGSPRYDWVDMFKSAVFYKKEDTRTFSVQVTPVRTYSDKQGIWTLHHYVFSQKKLQKLGQLLKSMDSEIRRELGLETIQQAVSFKWLKAIIQEVVTDYQERKKQEEARKVVLDLGALNKIRADAQVTQERLMTEEERTGEANAGLESTPACFDSGLDSNQSLPLNPGLDSNQSLASDSSLASNQSLPSNPGLASNPSLQSVSSLLSDPGTAHPWNLTDPEYRYLQCLLYGRPVDWVLQQGLMSSLLADAINDKCYEEFGDTVLDTAADSPCVIEDYEDDLKGQVKP